MNPLAFALDLGPLDLGPLDGPAASAPLPLPLDLADAVEAYLAANFVAAGLLSWAGSGKLPPGYAMPFASIGDLDEAADYQEDGSGHAPYDDHGTLPIFVAASTGSSAKSLAALVAASLTDAPLLFQDGLLLYIRRTNRIKPVLEDGDAPEGRQTWIAHLMFSTIVSRTL